MGEKKRKKKRKESEEKGGVDGLRADKPIDRWGEAGLHFIDYDLHDFG